MYVCMFVRICMYACIYVCNVCMYVMCVCVYVRTQACIYHSINCVCYVASMIELYDLRMKKRWKETVVAYLKVNLRVCLV